MSTCLSDINLSAYASVQYKSLRGWPSGWGMRVITITTFGVSPLASAWLASVPWQLCLWGWTDAQTPLITVKDGFELHMLFSYLFPYRKKKKISAYNKHTFDVLL